MDAADQDRCAALLARAREIADQVLAPQAQETDQASTLPLENVRVLAEAGLLGMSVPVEYGGQGAPGRAVREFMEILAGGCGVTAFLLFQHLGACRQIAGSENEALKERLLSLLARGERFCTLAFSHLRRPGPPVLRVEPEAGGYRFDGKAPWATGWGMATDLLLAGTLAGGDSLWVVVPAMEDGALQASPPLRLCAVNASATVSLTCRGLLAPRDSMVKTSTPQQLAADTYAGLLSHSMLSIGVAAAAIRVLRERAGSGRAFISGAADTLAAEADAARAAVHEWAERPDDPRYRSLTLRIRSWCIDLGVRAAHAAVVASAGGANSLDHPAQRLYREAMLYSVTALTGELQEQALGRIAVRGMQASVIRTAAE